MSIFKTALAVVFAATVFSAGVQADGTPPFEACVVNHDKYSEHKKGPIDVTYKGRTIQVCCKGCVRKFNKDPEKYLKAWDEALKKQGGATPASNVGPAVKTATTAPAVSGTQAAQ